jgi:hypothetical protein
VTRFSLRAIVLALSLAALLAAPAVSDAQSRVAVPRSRPGGSTVIVGARYYNPYYFYRPYYYGGYYSPWYYPFSFSLGFGYGYPCCGYPYYGGYPYYYGGYYGASALRVQVPQREAEVFIDGYYAGRVDNFDGTFQRLHLEPGEHDLELFLPGHRSFQQKIYTQPGSTFRVRHEMQPLGAGEAEPTRPVAPPRTTRAEPSSRSSRPTTRVPQRPPATTERAPDDPRPGNAESDFGSIALRVQPGDAIVMINGERWDGAQDQERIVVQLGAGTHNVEIRRDGYRTYITDITVRPGETTTLNVSLTRQ